MLPYRGTPTTHSSLAATAFPRRGWIGLSEHPHRSEAPSVAELCLFRVHRTPHPEPIYYAVTKHAMGRKQPLEHSASAHRVNHHQETARPMFWRPSRRLHQSPGTYTPKRWTTEDATRSSVTTYQLDLGAVGVRTVLLTAKA
ncbi:hypothetical protein TgHK011_006549 [Trichoderma gracile]|nr:hypothetical protein TgHK011_006549 [Trichoderma gracile]